MLDAEAVARSAQRVDQLGLEVVVDLTTQTPHEYLEHVREWVVILVPDVRGDLGAINDLIVVQHEAFEERELFRGEIDVASAAFRAMRRKIDLEVGDADDVGHRLRG